MEKKEFPRPLPQARVDRRSCRLTTADLEENLNIDTTPEVLARAMFMRVEEGKA